MQLQRRRRARQRRAVGHSRQRQHLAHQGAEISVFPFLDAPVRQAGALIGLERLLAPLGHPAGSRQPRARQGKRFAQGPAAIGFR